MWGVQENEFGFCLRECFYSASCVFAVSVRSHKIVILVRKNVSARVACIAGTRLYHKIAAQIHNHIWNWDLVSYTHITYVAICSFISIREFTVSESDKFEFICSFWLARTSDSTDKLLGSMFIWLEELLRLQVIRMRRALWRSYTMRLYRRFGYILWFFSKF